MTEPSVLQLNMLLVSTAAINAPATRHSEALSGSICGRSELKIVKFLYAVGSHNQHYGTFAV